MNGEESKSAGNFISKEVVTTWEIARSISDEENRSWALRDIAIELARAGKLDEALEIARSAVRYKS